jgi:hypothetical protein
MNLERPPLLTGLFVTCAFVVLAAASCGRPELPIAVHRARAGLRSDIQPGERVQFHRVASREYAGARPGFYSLRSKYEFELFRSDLPKSRALPPRDVAFGDEMIIAGYTDAEGGPFDKLEIHTIVDTGSQGLHVYARQYTAGDGCPPPPPGNAFDWVAMPNLERPISVHLDTERGPPCKASAPRAKVACRLAQTASWLPELNVPWQSTVECEAQVEPGARAVVDRNWFIGEAAKGSTTKLTLDRGGARVSFPLDVMGRYVIKLQTVDEDGARGETSATVNAIPPSDDTYVQFGWSSFSATDEIDTFPRLDVKVADIGPSGRAVRGAVCGVQGAKPGWCELTSSPVVTIMRVQHSPGRYGAHVRYLDDRYKGMPIACVRVFKWRAMLSEVCDDNPRKAGETWDAGAIVASQGLFEHLIPVPPDAGAPEPSDAGAAADATVSGKADAGAKKPAPKKPTDAGPG